MYIFKSNLNISLLRKTQHTGRVREKREVNRKKKVSNTERNGEKVAVVAQ